MRKATFSPRPREQPIWRPMINPDACIGDRLCIEVCQQDVFEWDEVAARAFVARPLDCAIGCVACAGRCPAEAIMLPSLESLRYHQRRLRREVGATAPITSFTRAE